MCIYILCLIVGNVSGMASGFIILAWSDKKAKASAILKENRNTNVLAGFFHSSFDDIHEVYLSSYISSMIKCLSERMQ